MTADAYQPSPRYLARMAKHPKRPRDPNQLAHMIVGIATGETEEAPVIDPAANKDSAAVSLGRRGGLKGGNARAEKLAPERRAEIAREAAKKRWHNRKMP